MRALARGGLGALAGVAATPAYALVGLTTTQVAASACLAALGCATAFALPVPGLKPPTAPRTRVTPRPPSLSEGLSEAAKTLSELARDVEDDRLRALLDRLATAARAGLPTLASHPLTPDRRRMLAYYVPASVRVARTLCRLDGEPAAHAAEREAAMAMLSRLAPMFESFAGNNSGVDVAALGRELALLDASLGDPGRDGVP